MRTRGAAEAPLDFCLVVECSSIVPEKNQTMQRSWKAMSKNRESILEVEKINSKGQGISHLADGRIAFIDDVLPGEKVKARIVSEKKSYAVCECSKILEHHPERVEPPCKWFGKCGGCQLQHCTYDLQLQLKRKILEDALSRIGRLDLPIEVEPCVPSPRITGYRNKASFPLRRSDDQTMPGFFMKASHQLVQVRTCTVLDEDLDALFRAMDPFFAAMGSQGYQEKGHKGIFRHLILRKAVFTGEMLLCLVVKRLPGKTLLDSLVGEYDQLNALFPSLKGFILNHNASFTNVILGKSTSLLAGRSYLQERVGDYSFRFDGTSFFQVNPPQAEKMFTHVASEVFRSGGRKIMELYSGVGTITSFLASKANSVTAVEEWPSAVEFMKVNLLNNGLDNVRIHVGKTETVIPDLRDGNFDTVVLDPPRAGCGKEVLEEITETIVPSTIVYVSCNPATLARDLSILKDGGYSIRRISPFDMFPQTFHVETVVTLEKRI